MLSLPKGTRLREFLVKRASIITFTTNLLRLDATTQYNSTHCSADENCIQWNFPRFPIIFYPNYRDSIDLRPSLNYRESVIIKKKKKKK